MNNSSYLSRISATFALVPLLLLNCVNAEEKADEVARTIAKAANYIYFRSFEQDPVVDSFTKNELETLSKHLGPLNSLIRGAIGVQHSIGGAMLMAHFSLKDNFDYLRSTMLAPGRFYGWEGSYTNDEDTFYSDEQYVYHSKYLKAIEKLMNAPLHEVIILNNRERKHILDISANPNHESYHWSIWIGRKLRIF
jgi:hypothetical protein